MVYFLLIAGVFRENPWCVRISLIPPLVGFLVTMPLVVYNFYAFSINDPMYQDSPATIFVVAIMAIFITIPSGLVIAAYWRSRRLWFPHNT